jgi:hypothetical protein
MFLPLLVLFWLFPTANAGALETDDLILGMTPDGAASIYTSLRSCSNAVYTERPGFMAWEASLHGRNAEIEVRFASGLSNLVVVRMFLESGDTGRDLFDFLIACGVRDHGPAREAAADYAVWSTPGGELRVERELSPDRREIRLIRNAVSY